MADQTQEIDNPGPATQAGDPSGKILAVTATFTAELVKEPLEFWVKQLDLRAKIKFAPFNQVFQQLLDPVSLLARNLDGANVILLRIEDLRTAENGHPDEIDSQFESSIDELLVALRASAQRSAIPHLVFVCPPSEAVRVQPEVVRATERAVVHLAAGAVDIPGVQVVTPAELL